MCNLVLNLKNKAYYHNWHNVNNLKRENKNQNMVKKEIIHQIKFSSSFLGA